MRTYRAAALALFGVLLFASLFASVPTAAQEPGVGIMQSDDAKNLTHEQNRMYMYGNSDTGAPDTWSMWTHSANNDVNSDDSVGEGNIPGAANQGGGPRTFTFEGTNPVSEAMPIDNSIAIVGKVKLNIYCDVLEQNSCTKQTDIVLRLGNRDLAVQTIAEPAEDYFYEFEFFVNVEEIPAGETFGLRVSFQKPQSTDGGYTLYLGNQNSFMDIPVVEPYQPTVPGLDGLEYISPYEEASGYTMSSSNSTSIIGLIFWGLLGIGIFVAGFTFIPPIPLRELAILFTGLGLLVSMLVAPIIAGPVQMSKVNPDDPGIWTIDELAQLDERPDSFLGDSFVVDYEFKLYVEYDDVYTAKNRGETISAFGYDEFASIFEDPEVPQRGKEYVQLYFSMFHIDLRPGQAVLVDLMIVNSTDSAGQTTLVPLHACMDCTHPETGANWEVMDVKVNVNGEESIRFAIHNELCEIIGVDSTWGVYAHGMTALGLLMGGIGFWMSFKQNREYYSDDEEDEEESDDDFEDALDDLEDF
ncbi:MAG: hypothetical protein VYA86_05520 [Candidatus Thermoplasmatota archaeon]|nr:hypothetical protein [Candidatus Thermoplasmatota archaeon]